LTSPAVRVLLTEDVAADAELELRELKRAGLRVSHRTVDTEESFAAALREFAPDVILSDFSMPGFDGMAALAMARERSPETPFIFVSGTIGEEYAIRALRNGATDYVLKTNLVRLPAAVERALLEAKKRRELQRLSRIRDIVSSVNSALVRLRERKPLFDELCRIAVSYGGFAAARIVEVDRAGKVALAATTEADPRAFQAEVDEYNLDPSRADSLLADALHRGQPVISSDVALLPILVEARVAGLVVLRSKDPGFFDRGELNLLAEMVSNISFALELMDKQERISYLALYDLLTGLPNRTLFHERLAQAMEALRGTSGRLGLVLIDLERFKAINDTFGQQLGDRVLQAVAQRLRDATDINRVARLGSNLFAVVFHGISGAEEVARHIEAAEFFSRPIQVDDREVRLAGKAGIAVFPEDGADAGALLRNAEASLKQAKETGERYLFYAPHINARVAEQVELEHRLRRAVEHGEIFLHYQPKLDLASGRIVGLEALMRWSGPEGLLVSPVKFVPVLEQTGLILEAGRQAFAAASAAYHRWQARGLPSPRIAVNVSALQLRRRSFALDVRDAVANAGADGGGIDIEVTESLLMTDVDESIRKLRELRAMGILIALDDFGTGYSSLAYLSKLPVDSLKIDRGFIRGMTENADDTSIVATIISLAQSLRLRVVAEGVETEQQAQLLRLLRCDQAQGYLFSPPVAAEHIEAMLEAVSPDRPMK
jgi:diguanylate cyclase (GGDEF)-like protein